MEAVQGKVAVITGAASGIGLGIARRAVQLEMKVVLADIERDALDKAVAELTDQGADVIGVPTDVRDLAAIEGLRDAALERFGAVHLLCNNAGVGGGGMMWELPIETWKWVLEVDLWSVIFGVRTFVPVMLEQGEGHIVNTASVAGLTSTPGMGPYNVAKHGVVTLSETLFHELSFTGANVGVSVLCPAWVNTRIHESQRNAPAEVAALLEADPSDPEAEGIRAMMQMMVESGLDPAQVGRDVLDAVMANRFYVLTHPESIQWVQLRLDGIINGTGPASGFG